MTCGHSEDMLDQIQLMRQQGLKDDWIIWFQCPQCGNREDKLKDFEKVGKIEMDDGRKLVHYKCRNCGSPSPREDLYRSFNAIGLRNSEGSP